MSATVPPNPTSPTTGFVKWTNTQDNLREVDLNWLQNRGVARFDNAAALTSYELSPTKVDGALAAGQLVYLLNNSSLQLKTASEYLNVLTAKRLQVNEAGTNTSITNQGVGGMTIAQDGSVTLPNTSLASGSLVVNGSSVTIKTSSTSQAVTLTTTGNNLVVSNNVNVPGLNVVGNIVCSGSINSSSATIPSISSTNVTASSVTASTVTATNAVASTSLKTPSISPVSSSSSARVDISRISSTDAIINTLESTDISSPVVKATDHLQIQGRKFKWDTTWGLRVARPGFNEATHIGWRLITNVRVVHSVGLWGATTWNLSDHSECYANDIQAGTAAALLTSASMLRIDFPRAFNNGVTSVVATQGDNTIPFAHVMVKNVTNTYFDVHVYDSTAGFGVRPGSAVRINWIAVGW